MPSATGSTSAGTVPSGGAVGASGEGRVGLCGDDAPQIHFLQVRVRVPVAALLCCIVSCSGGVSSRVRVCASARVDVGSGGSGGVGAGGELSEFLVVRLEHFLVLGTPLHLVLHRLLGDPDAGGALRRWRHGACCCGSRSIIRDSRERGKRSKISIIRVIRGRVQRMGRTVAHAALDVLEAVVRVVRVRRGQPFPHGHYRQVHDHHLRLRGVIIVTGEGLEGGVLPGAAVAQRVAGVDVAVCDAARIGAAVHTARDAVRVRAVPAHHAAVVDTVAAAALSVATPCNTPCCTAVHTRASWLLEADI